MKGWLAIKNYNLTSNPVPGKSFRIEEIMNIEKSRSEKVSEIFLKQSNELSRKILAAWSLNLAKVLFMKILKTFTHKAAKIRYAGLSNQANLD